jgi:hypothetical protein
VIDERIRDQDLGADQRAVRAVGRLREERAVLLIAADAHAAACARVDLRARLEDVRVRGRRAKQHGHDRQNDSHRSIVTEALPDPFILSERPPGARRRT